MISDFRSAEDGTRIEADLCIIGAGAAGITLARAFLGSGVRVCVLESGGFELEPATQELAAGENVGQAYEDLEATRLRYFGGTTNHWAGTCAPLAPIDFQPRAWVPHSGWPFTRAELEPFYRRAHPICELGAFSYGRQVWQELGRRPDAFNPAVVELDFLRESPPTRFGEVYRAELEQADNVHVLLHANARDIRTDEAARAVRHVELASLTGTRAEVVARIYVLAAGGLENARLLLASDGVEPAGLGNRHDLVGRFFMEHPHTEPGIVVHDEASLTERYLRRYELSDGAEASPIFGAAPALQARHRALGAHSLLFEVPGFDSGVRAARELWLGARKGDLPAALGEKVWYVVRDLDDLASYAYARLVSGERPSDLVQLGFAMRSEQAPNPDSRVTLAEDRDALGMRRLQLDWRLTERDKHAVLTLTRALGAEFARLGLGRVRVADWLSEAGNSWPADMLGGYHHMGTTRMHDDPKRGVVDADCRVHHVDNLYLAGSSVFPTGGSVNPTLTIVALALRLAEHLERRLG